MVARTATEALLLAEQIGFPIAMKVDSPDLTHKTDAGGVRLNIMNAPAVSMSKSSATVRSPCRRSTNSWPRT